eukprot:sb/3464101/
MVKAAKRPGGQKTEKDPSIFSQEYFLQNQADLMSSLCLIIMSGLLFKPTRALSAKFCFVQHNTTNLTDPEIKPMYKVGQADILVTVFYSLLCIAVHAVENEYFWEKIARRLRLSKTRLSEFMALGSTLPYHIAIVFGAVYVMKEEGLLLDPMALLTTVPVVEMPMLMKFYWLLILSFALHQYPEMYFMRVKNEEMPNKIIGYTAFIVPMTAAYISGQLLGFQTFIINYNVKLFIEDDCEMALSTSYWEEGTVPNRKLFQANSKEIVVTHTSHMWNLVTPVLGSQEVGDRGYPSPDELVIEEMPNKIIGYTAFIVPMTAAYISGQLLGFQTFIINYNVKLFIEDDCEILVYPGTVVLIIHCLIEIMNAIATVMDCAGKQELAQPFYKMWSVGFIPARATITGLCALTFFNIQGAEGVSPVRLLACTIVLGGMVALQFYLAANFIHTVLNWRSQAQEVELAQKKADNFWQQRKEANKEAKKARAEKRVAKEAVVAGKTD